MRVQVTITNECIETGRNESSYLCKMLHPNACRVIQSRNVPAVREDILLESRHGMCQHSTRRDHRQIASHRLVALVLEAQSEPGNIAPAVRTSQGRNAGIIGYDLGGFVAGDDPALRRCGCVLLACRILPLPETVSWGVLN